MKCSYQLLFPEFYASRKSGGKKWTAWTARTARSRQGKRTEKGDDGSRLEKDVPLGLRQRVNQQVSKESDCFSSQEFPSTS